MVNPSDSTNYYEVLEVMPDAPAHAIHKAYQRAKSTYSSDNPALYSMFSQEEADELLKLIEEAYLVLGNPTARKTYDEARSRGESPTARDIIGVAPQATSSNSPSSHSSLRAPPSPVSSASTVASVHQSLPDFGPPATHHLMGAVAKSSVSSPAQPTSLTPSSTPPMPQASSAPAPGTGKTSLSTYKVDEHFEVEFGGATDWDGQLLQRVRLYKNISIDRLSEVTRISRPYLAAVEANDYKALPAAVFVRGFVVQLARALGLNEAKVAGSYMKIFKASGGK